MRQPREIAEAIVARQPTLIEEREQLASAFLDGWRAPLGKPCEQGGHVPVMIGQPRCVRCGMHLGVVCVVFPDFGADGWKKFEEIRSRRRRDFLEWLPDEIPGIHLETLAEYLAHRIAYEALSPEAVRA